MQKDNPLIRVAIVDDHKIITEGLAHLVEESKMTAIAKIGTSYLIFFYWCPVKVGLPQQDCSPANSKRSIFVTTDSKPPLIKKR